MENAYRWIVAFDVAPEWVADGFVMSDERALEMLASDLSFAEDFELAATVIAAPAATAIAAEQGYLHGDAQHRNEITKIEKGAPSAGSLDAALVAAIGLIDSVAFVREEGDGTADVLAKLRGALELVRGPVPDQEV